jgi:hypothetical protein
MPLAIALCRLFTRMERQTKRDRFSAQIWDANRERLIGDEHTIGYRELKRRRILLESAIYHADPKLKAMMIECAAELSRAREALIQRGYTAIFAPFHFCSDAVATVTAAMVPPYRCHAYSIYSQNYFGNDEADHLKSFGAELIQHHPDNPATHQRVMLREVRTGLANIVIFPDILPQFTAGLLGRVMRTRNVTLFDREARLHSGAEEIARMAGGKLIPYYVYWKDRRLSIRIFEPCEDIEEIASCIEQSLRECGDQWLLWHFPSLFYFCDGRAV